MIGMRRISGEGESGIVFFRPAGADPGWDTGPRLTPWAAFFRRFAAGFLGPLRGFFNLGLPVTKQAMASWIRGGARSLEQTAYWV